MKIIRNKIAIAGLSGLLLAGFAEASGRTFIAHGWDTMKATPADVLANAAALEQSGFDGLTLVLPARTQADGSKVEPWNLPTDPAWQYETYADQVPILQKITVRDALRESFLMCAFTPMRGRIAWTNDAGWARFASNMRVFARLAKNGGVRGLFLDNEDYCSRRQFVLLPGDGLVFDDAYRLARRRGREVFGAVYGEFPDAVVLPFWLLSQVQSLVNSVDPNAAMRNTGALWPAFVNGLFDALPPTGRVVDGNEYAYTYEWNNGTFAASAADQLVGFLPLIAPENRAKYRAQLCAGFGLYIDMYVNEKGSSWYFAPINGSRLEHFRLNLTEAAKRADEYIWVYGEKFSFVKWQGLDTKGIRFKHDVTWEDQLPGLARMIREVKNPGAGLMDRVHAARAKGANLFSAALKRESHWQNPKCKQGAYTVDPNAGVGGTITLKAIVNGCANLPIDAKPGETYVFDMWMTGSCGSGQKPTMCFMDEKGKYHWELGTVNSSLVEKDSVGRSRFCAVARVPEKMAGINLMLNGGQRNNETGSFTDIFISKCEE